VTSDKTVLFFSASLLIFALSLFLPLVSVHTYCENRSVAAVFGAGAIAVFLLFVRNRATSTARRVASGVGQILCVLAIAVNVAFMIYATHLCRHMFGRLR